MTTKQQAAIDAANTEIGLMAQFRALAEQIDGFLARDSNENYLATWALMPTAPLNADGTVSATADATPVVANPITIPTTAPLLRSKNQLANGRQLLVDFKAFMTNNAVTAQNRRGWIDDLVG